MSGDIRTEAVTSAAVTATGTVVSGQGRLRGVSTEGAGAGGILTLRDGGAGGTVILTMSVAAVDTTMIEVPGAGISFATDLHATLSTVAGFTAIYATDNTL